MGRDDGCDHAWRTAGRAGPFPWKGNVSIQDVEEALDEKGENADSAAEDDLRERAEALALEACTFWEAFSRFCRTKMKLEPETVLFAHFPPILSWIEETLNSKDKLQVDENLAEEYEAALTEVWREHLQNA